MDIDDILRSVSSPTSGTLSPETDLSLLVRTYTSERLSPELLPYPSALLERTNARISAQIARIEDMMLSAGSAPSSGAQDTFALVVIQTELERVRFLVRSLLRARLEKIGRCGYFYAGRQAELERQASEREEEPVRLLSELEQKYLAHHTALLEGHFKASFLGGFPGQLQKMDDTGGGISMVEKPSMERAVFVRVLRDDAGTVVVHGEQGDGEVQLTRGDVWVLRWKDVRQRVARGDVELI